MTIWFPTIHKKFNKRRGEESGEPRLGLDGEPMTEDFDERSMEQKELIIHSEPLIKALRSIVQYYPGQSLLGDNITLKEPYPILVHYRKELQEYMEGTDAETSHHISVLLQYLQDNLGDKILEEDARYVKPTPVATFEMLWMLFKPGCDVYAQIDEQRGGFVVQSCEPVTENRTWGQPVSKFSQS